jgi:hypothetical protein
MNIYLEDPPVSKKLPMNIYLEDPPVSKKLPMSIEDLPALEKEEDPLVPEKVEEEAPPVPEPEKEEDEPDAEEPIGKFLLTGQTVSMSFWYALGVPNNIGPHPYTVELPAYRFTGDTGAVPPTRYFYVPAGIVSSNNFYDDFFISEQTIAAHLLIRSELEKLSTRKQRIIPWQVFNEDDAMKKFKEQYEGNSWDNFAFSALKPDGTEIEVRTLTKDMLKRSDSEFAKLRTWSEFITRIKKNTVVK